MPRARACDGPEPAHFAVARLNQSVDGFDQRRLSRPVLAEKRMDLLRPDIDVDRFVGEKIAVALGQAHRLEQRRFAGMQAGSRRI